MITLDLPRIELDELVARGELLTRVDRKYVLAPAQAAALVDRLAEHARVLTIADARDFGYESLYFDTPALTSYRLAAHNRRRRFKVRRRTYLGTGQSFLEVKYRGPRGATVKERRPDPDRTLRDDFLDHALDRSGAGRDVGEHLLPVLTTRYRRTTLFLPETGSRITLDAELTWHSPAGECADLGSRVVVETKSAGSPCLADRLLWADRCRPARISKYCTGLALLTPDLPANRWHRVLHDLTQPTFQPRTSP